LPLSLEEQRGEVELMETRCTLCQEAEPLLFNNARVRCRDARRRRDTMELYMVIHFDDTYMLCVIFSTVDKEWF
jgi:hypothetical protein